LVFEIIDDEIQKYSILKGKHTIYVIFLNGEQSNTIEFEAGSAPVLFEACTISGFFKNTHELLFHSNIDQIVAFINSSGVTKMPAKTLSKGRINFVVENGAYVEKGEAIAIIYGSMKMSSTDFSNMSMYLVAPGDGVDRHTVKAITDGYIRFIVPDGSIVNTSHIIAKIDVPEDWLLTTYGEIL